MIKKFENFGNKSVVIYHGLGSKPAPVRSLILKRLGYDVISELFDYESEWNLDKGKSLFENQLEIVKNADLIIGISFGGYLAYNLAKSENKPLILINPALDRDKSKTNIKHFDISYIPHKIDIEVFLGENDVSIPKEITIDFLNKTNDNFTYNIIHKMEHRIPDEFFRQIIKQSRLI